MCRGLCWVALEELILSYTEAIGIMEDEMEATML